MAAPDDPTDARTRAGESRPTPAPAPAPGSPAKRPAGREATPGGTFIGPRKGKRRGIESIFVRLVATSGIVGIGVAMAAILGSQDVDHWIVGLVVALVSVVLAAVLWSSRTL